MLSSDNSVPILQSYILEPLSLAAAIFLTYFNHTRTRTSSAILLIFWPLYAIGLAIWIRTVLATPFENGRVVLLFKLFAAGNGLLSFFLECFGPEYDTEPSLGDKDHMENPLITANIFSVWVCFEPLKT